MVQKRGQIITSTQTKNQTKTQPKRPANQPDLRFAKKANSEATKNGAGPKQDQTKQLEICLEYSDLSHCIVIKNMQTNYKGGPHRVSKKSADFRCRKRTLWTWRGAAPIVIERSENVETLPLYIAKVEGCKGATFSG